MAAKNYSNIVFATSYCIIFLLFLFLSMEKSEATRNLQHKEDQEESVIIFMGKDNLLLPSLQWRPVRSPKSNPGTNVRTNIASQVSERNFIGRKELVAHPPPLSNSFQ
ncbi:hypothetical protein EJD97_003951 [Solanum chilense]|uniref:Uncharacterized protein n=1 Tax=Solanum chilense TaxID=4083 RepID=A0A6N2BUB9_SOLCI|nr:hypothetical protein EJD97_003951 [Solanum chilense]